MRPLSMSVVVLLCAVMPAVLTYIVIDSVCNCFCFWPHCRRALPIASTIGALNSSNCNGSCTLLFLFNDYV